MEGWQKSGGLTAHRSEKWECHKQGSCRCAGFSWYDSELCITAQFSHIETQIPSFLTMPQLKILKMTPLRLRLHRPGTLKTILVKGLKINFHTSCSAPRVPKRPRPQTRNIGGKRKNNTVGQGHRFGVETKVLRWPVLVQPRSPLQLATARSVKTWVTSPVLTVIKKVIMRINVLNPGKAVTLQRTSKRLGYTRVNSCGRFSYRGNNYNLCILSYGNHGYYLYSVS